ncbi:MAG: T9SS type A sorting domain-containing protein [Ignavibacterium sp.]
MKNIIFLLLTYILLNSIIVYSQIIELRDSLSGIQKKYYSNFPIARANHSENLNYDTLPVIKESTLVNSHSGEYGAEQSELSIAMDSSGNYLCVWVDLRDGNMNIYAQLYDRLDRKIGNNFIVNNGKIWGNIDPIVSVNKKGDFVVVWGNDLREIYARRISNTGQFLSEPLRLNSNNQINTFPISAAVAENGSFIAVWGAEQYYQAPWLYAVVVDNNNNISDEIIVDEANSSNIAFLKARKATVAGDCFLIVFPSIMGRMFAQKVSLSGERIGNNFLINEINYSNNSYDVKVASLQGGNSLILWKANNLFGRVYNPQSGFITGEFFISDSVYSFNLFTDRDSTFYISYNYNGTDYFRKINREGLIVSERIRAEYDSMFRIFNFGMEISDLSNNSFIIGRAIYNRSDLNCWIQKLNSDFLPLTSAEKVHDDLYSSWQIFPKVKFNSQGQALVVWEDRRNGRKDLYGRVVDENFEPIGDDFQINETSANFFFTYEKAISAFSDGTFVVAFWKSESTTYGVQLVLQLISPSGQKIGNNKNVTDIYYSYGNYSISLNVNSRDELLLCWYNYFHALTRLFDKNLNPLTNTETILLAKDNIGFRPLKISIDENHLLLAVWRDYSIYNGYTYPLLKGRFFNYRPISEVFVIDSAADNVYKLECANDSSNNFIVMYGTFNQIKIKRFYDFPSQNIFTDNYYIFNPSDMKIVKLKNKKALVVFRNSYEGSLHSIYFNDNRFFSDFFFMNKLEDYSYYLYYFDYYPVFDADIIGNKFLLSFSEVKPQNGTDIFMKVLDASKFNFNKEASYLKTKTDFLYNNFPNPFNNKTVIAYQTLSFSKVKLSVYDILGNLVRVLVDEYQQPGIYEVEFNAGELSSGIYFYKLEAFNTITKKMMIVK